MKFTVECGGFDGLVLMDQSYLDEMNSELLYSMDTLLDHYGKSELIFDFSKENWDIVRERESKAIKNFCNCGKMIVCLLPNGDQQGEFKMVDELLGSLKWLRMPTGKLLAVTASELIQCVSYPDLEMEKVFELQLEKGWYAISISSKGEIFCSPKTSPIYPFENIQEY
ncbi:hypothetical protein [Clostridium sp. JS66]|uniref:hypothetical protein n=1 Tax=Clostridium sp. JS66 TaxID=3064705 RepID=UPI00298DF629|nr:hypothetical protein [Clostridium sp. JS66]WPC43907.1 hypothetical protein Q6H37_10645 [Clostridium sp. JS66]